MLAAQMWLRNIHGQKVVNQGVEHGDFPTHQKRHRCWNASFHTGCVDPNKFGSVSRCPDCLITCWCQGSFHLRYFLDGGVSLWHYLLSYRHWQIREWCGGVGLHDFQDRPTPTQKFTFFPSIYVIFTQPCPPKFSCSGAEIRLNTPSYSVACL